MSKPILYTFAGSVWVHAPLVAITESGYAPGDITLETVNLAQGANFNPEFLKVNPNGTVPVFVTTDGHKYESTISSVKEILKRAPKPPKHDAHHTHELDKIIKEIHNPAHDPNDLFFLPVDDADREAKAKGIVGGFLANRQKALEAFAPDAPAEFKAFLEGKQRANGHLLEFFTGNPDQEARTALYTSAQQLWDHAGQFIRGEVTHLLKKSNGSYLNGQEPGEADYHLITWLARIITNAGVQPNSISGVALKAVQERTGGQEIDPVVAGFWDSWTQRESFKVNGVA
ncbi:hypothetical protein Q8F55_001411 [Vanrija albida]|uniref:GST N-terminal domain-containing protein n=1 Tax=Vanrija albida TaxID=181172 RepID=A0ABR3QFY2_9TREE